MATALKSLTLGSMVVLSSDLTAESQRLEGLIGEKSPKLGNVTDNTTVAELLTTLGAKFPAQQES